MTKPALLAAACLAAGCATTGATSDAPRAAPRQEKIALSNLSNFDLAACGPRPFTLAAVTQETVVGALLVGRPLMQECLVDATARGPEETTQATVKVTVSDTGVTTQVDGPNLTPKAKECVTKAVARLPLAALPKGEKPVEGAVGLLHVASTSPSVKLGINAASDIVGVVRLAQLDLCDCYGALSHEAPPSFKAKLDFSPTAPVAVSWEGADEGAARALATCIEPRLKALPFAKPAGPLGVPYPFRLVDSYARQENVNAEPQLQFAQLDAIRSQRMADVAMLLGGRFVAGTAYDALVQKYKAKPAPALIPELKSRCQALLAADDRWLQGLAAVVDVEQKVVTLAQDLSARDITWAPTVDPAQKSFVRAQADVAQAEKQKQADAQACPKSN